MTEHIHLHSTIQLNSRMLASGSKVLWENVNDKDLNQSLKEVYQLLDMAYPKFYKMDNLSKFGVLAVEALVKVAPELKAGDLEKTGVFLMNSSSSEETDEKYLATVNTEENSLPSPALFVYTLPNILIGEICIRHKFTGEQGFFVSAHFDSGFLYPYLEHLFQNELLEKAIIGWVEVKDEEPVAKLMYVKNNQDGGAKKIKEEAMKNWFQA
ncbi:MAG: hypothetical protein R2784_00890 [Saprospiraceae bacterium]